MTYRYPLVLAALLLSFAVHAEDEIDVTKLTPAKPTATLIVTTPPEGKTEAATAVPTIADTSLQPLDEPAADGKSAPATLAEIVASPKEENKEESATNDVPAIPSSELHEKPDAPWADYITDQSVPTVKASNAPVKKKPEAHKQKTKKQAKVKKKPANDNTLEEQFSTARVPQAAPQPLLAAPVPEEKALPYLPAGALSPELLPAPPAEKSAAHKKQIARVLDAQKNISVDDMTALVDEQHLEVSHVTSAIDGFDIDVHPATRHLLQRVLATGEASARAAKKYWGTRRPYLTDKRVKLMVEKINESPAYPSGHTAAARLLAEVLGLLLPEKRDILRARADGIAWHRVQAGVHYPVDLEGGRFLAGMMLGSLLTDTDFQRDLNAAAIELSVTPSQIAN